MTLHTKQRRTNVFGPTSNFERNFERIERKPWPLRNCAVLVAERWINAIAYRLAFAERTKETV